VRPTYSGGPATILEAFHIAGLKRICSPQTILTLLAKLNFRYPYLQAIGFYMERSGQYSEHLQLIYKKCALQFDFYVSHNEDDLEYSSRWKIYFPKWLKTYWVIQIIPFHKSFFCFLFSIIIWWFLPAGWMVLFFLVTRFSHFLSH